MCIRHERGEFVLNAEELVYRVVVPLKFLALDFALKEPLENVSGKPLRWRLPIERVLAQVVRDSACRDR